MMSLLFDRMPVKSLGQLCVFLNNLNFFRRGHALRKTSNIPAIIIGFILFVGLFGSNYTVTLSAPDYAIVYVDPDKKIYYAPPYIDNLSQLPKPAEPINVKNLQRATLKEVGSLGYRIDEVSKDKDYFEQKYRTLTSYMLEKIGFLKPLPPRWNPDGAWNW